MTHANQNWIPKIKRRPLLAIHTGRERKRKKEKKLEFELQRSLC